jgi:hypothetical protein
MARFLYPEDSARKTFNRGKFLLRSLLYRAQLNRVFELFQSAPLRALPPATPSCSTSRCAPIASPARR